ncbi:MAG: glycosyltransferase [Candidatus Eremiobacteraeota bacterium]|nr:glycosyltransferase [Candidatus Eremiobacteraeota bacterium]
MEILALLACLAVLVLGLRVRAESLGLEHFEALPDQELPGISVIIAARDEERVVEAALVSLLELDYPDLEVVFVDDRSVDRTGEIAKTLAENHPGGSRLKVITCRELPSGWLGKMHALHLGTKASTKPLVLLTDADVVFERDSLKRAASAQQVLQTDHLAVAPLIETSGFWEPALVSFFLVMFVAKFRPSRVHRDRKRFVGVGAFNMLTRQALERVEYLEPLRLQVIEDVHLGRLVKSRGMTQFCLISGDSIRVRWVEGLRGVVTGLEKNSYAGLDYSLPFSLAAIPIVAVPFWLPVALFILGLKGWAASYMLFCFLVGALIPRNFHLPTWVGLTFPLSALVLAYTFARSVWITEKQGGVIWRGTLYPLEELRAAHREFVRDVAPL